MDECLPAVLSDELRSSRRFLAERDVSVPQEAQDHRNNHQDGTRYVGRFLGKGVAWRRRTVSGAIATALIASVGRYTLKLLSIQGGSFLWFETRTICNRGNDTEILTNGGNT